MNESRRRFLGTGAIGLAGALLPPAVRAAKPQSVRPPPSQAPPLIKPPRLKPGDTVGLINPVCTPLRSEDLHEVTSRLEALEMRVKWGDRLLDCTQGREVGDAERAREINALFADPSVKALLPIRGGWGSARLLPHLDYDLIRRHPKVLMGFSDIAALLVGIHCRTGLVTFHGPMGTSSWIPFTVEQMKRVLFRAEAATLSNPAPDRRAVEEPDQRVHTVVPGRARGRLLGGNLTVLCSMLGSPYLTGAHGVVLFLEEIREPLPEVDRRLTQLRLTGILDGVRGVVFGQCTSCLAPEISPSITLDGVLRDQMGGLGVPVWRGALIGHIERQITVPIGVPAEIDAVQGTIRLLEPAVS
jgi:muramoyltetrapeptide carboxypeptidase